MNTRLCLIAKAGDPDAARVRIGLQQAAAAAREVNVQQTAIPADAASDSSDVLAYAASLLQQHCAIAVAVGDLLHDAVAADDGPENGQFVAWIYVSRSPVRAAPVLDLQPEQATAARIAAETQTLVTRSRKA